MVHRRALAIDVDLVRPIADEVLVVVRLELVRLVVKGDEVGDAEVRHSGRELVAHGERQERRVAAGATARDLGTRRIDVAALGEIAHGCRAVLDVDLAPAAAQAIAIFASVAGAPAVVEIDESDAATRVELDVEIE